jgi:hypothetical protein
MTRRSLGQSLIALREGKVEEETVTRVLKYLNTPTGNNARFCVTRGIMPATLRKVNHFMPPVATVRVSHLA